MRALDRLRRLCDPDRLAVAGALAVAPRTTDDLVAATGIDRRRALEALGDLRTAGLVGDEPADDPADDPDGAPRHALDVGALRGLAGDLAELALPMDPAIGYGMTDDEREVLARFFSGRTLVEVPSSRAKRLVVLERLALEFDVGRRYPEREVNSILGGFHPDWSTLRRHLVDEGLLDRERNVYWRSGGRVPGVHRP